jgi:hypothetical protein
VVRILEDRSMRQLVVMSLFAVTLAAGAVGAQEAAAPSGRLTKLWETKEGLKTPESVLLDPKDDVLYVSNVNEHPWEKDGNGYISKLSRKGEFLAVKWVEGLNGPKGLGIANRKLYVTDIDELVEIDIASGKIVGRYGAAGAKNLNDVATGPDGTVYVSDSAGPTAYMLKAGRLIPLSDKGDLAKINGLLVTKDGLMLGFPDRLGLLDLKTKVVKTVVPDTGGIDGIAAVGDGSFIISDWAGKIQLVQAGKPSVVLLDTTAKKVNAADLSFIAADRTLLVPTFFDDKVVAYRLK